MSSPQKAWARAMRDGNLRLAWEISERSLRERDPRTRNDKRSPYHMRWVWDGRPLAGRDVLVRCYHGLGDTIQFARYLPVLRSRAASVTLELQPRLACLFAEGTFADLLHPFDPARPLPEAECEIEIMELAFALRASPTAVRPPYIRTQPAALPEGTLGICCEAGEWDTSRSIAAELLEPVCEGRDCITLDPKPSALPVLNPEGCPYDIARTASLVAGVALVITVDTMIAHLAGAMDKPTWLLLKHEPDWRWSADQGASDWYPSMRLYSQPSPGDWRSVVERVIGDLNARSPG